MKHPLVTIIIPVYNVARYLSDALDSVIYQTYSNLEIIVIDDGSDDGSESICDDYAKKDNRIKVIHQENQGLSSARNAGLDVATGDVISFLDSDDAFHPDMIKTLVEEMKRTQAEIVICGFSGDNSFEETTFETTAEAGKVIDRASALKRVAAGRINTAVWDKIYVRDIWNNLRFPDGYVYEGTYIVFDIFAGAERIALVDENLVMHRRRSGSICNTYSLKNILDSHRASLQFIHQLEKYTPEVFSKEVYEKKQRERTRQVIADYLRYSYLHKGDRRGREEIRRNVRKAGSGGCIKRCSIPVRIIYFEIKHMPGLAVLSYRFFRLINRVGGSDSN